MDQLENEKRISLVRINNDNIELACKIQNSIFPEEDGRQNFIEMINHDPYRKELDYSIVYLDEKPIGVTGIYSYHEYPTTAWLGWFGVLKEFRNKGYGSIIFDKTMKLAIEKGYREFRLYTDESATSAHKLYEGKGLIKELYDNPADRSENSTVDVYIYSISLTDEPVSLWNNKTLGLKEQSEKQNLYK